MNMRKTLFLMFSLFLISATSNSAAAGPKTQSKPNIIVIMGDDHAQWAVGAYGMEEISTPNID